jgi:hypothetical protein
MEATVKNRSAVKELTSKDISGCIVKTNSFIPRGDEKMITVV